jgi:Ataxin-2 C-terminal region
MGGGAGSISVRFNPDAKPFVPKGAAAPVILETSSQLSSPTEATKSLKPGDEPAAAPAAEEQKAAELVAAI